MISTSKLISFSSTGQGNTSVAAAPPGPPLSSSQPGPPVWLQPVLDWWQAPSSSQAPPPPTFVILSQAITNWPNSGGLVTCLNLLTAKGDVVYNRAHFDGNSRAIYRGNTSSNQGRVPMGSSFEKFPPGGHNILLDRLLVRHFSSFKDTLAPTRLVHDTAAPIRGSGEWSRPRST